MMIAVFWDTMLCSRFANHQTLGKNNLYQLHGVTSQKVVIFMITWARTFCPIYFLCISLV